MKKTTYIFVITSILMISSSLYAQSPRKFWEGLQKAQEQEDLPKGNAQVIWPERKPFILSKLLFSRDALRGDKDLWALVNWVLIDDLSLSESGLNIFDHEFEEKIAASRFSDHIFNAVVPGTVLETLVDRGVFPDPYFGLNNLSIPDSISQKDWWYRGTFNVARLAEEEHFYIQFAGINYRSEIYLNGHRIGSSRGAFTRTEIDITPYLSKESNQNIVAVHVFPPDHVGIPHEQSMKAGQGLNGGALSKDGPTFISSVGWDWMPGIRGRNTGIWQEVTVRRFHSLKIEDPQIISDLPLPETDVADLYLNIPVRNLSSRAMKFKLTANIRNQEYQPEHKLDITLEKELEIPANGQKILSLSPLTDSSLHITDPLLWWPNGYGDPNLYELSLSTQSEDGETEYAPIQFGIREMSYELSAGNKIQRLEYSPCDRIAESKDGDRLRFSFVPTFDNEKRIAYPNRKDNAYTKNFYIPGLVSQQGIRFIENDSTSPYLIIKVNGKRIFCRGGNWGMDDAMKRKDDIALENAIALHAQAGFNIIRNWTGETTQENFYTLCDRYGLLVWNDFWITTDDTVEPEDQQLFLDNARDAVLRFRNHPSIAIWCPRNEGFAPEGLEQPLNIMINELDPTRHYHGQSRFLNMGTSGPWGYYKDLSWYFEKRAEGFNTEMGSFAIPTAITLRKFISPEDYWPINDVWAYHDLHHTTQNFQDFIEDIQTLGKPDSMDDFSMKAQVRCYDAWRAMIESWNERIWDNTTGLILWMSHPAWPSMIWQTYTYDLETPASYFGAKKACEMIHIQMNPSHEVSVIDVDAAFSGKYTVNAQIFDAQGQKLWKKCVRLKLRHPDFHHSCLEIPDQALPNQGSYWIRLTLEDATGHLLSRNEYWHHENKVSRAAVTDISCERMSSADTEDHNAFIIQNRSGKVATGIKLNAIDPETREIRLPAYFSDSYFTLLPGESRMIFSSGEEIICTEAVNILTPTAGSRD